MILEPLYGPTTSPSTDVQAASLAMHSQGSPAGWLATELVSSAEEAARRGWNRVGWRCHVPCKINLFLEVLGKRPDGYHDLDTVMLAISLCDTLDIFPRSDDQLRLELDLSQAQSLSGTGSAAEDPAWCIPTDASNLVLRALEQLRVSLGQSSGADVVLRKRIPSQAGLGGGSADAAAALVLGSLLWQSRWDLGLARTIASQLGSDINFFLEGYNGSNWTARCRGRGERVEPIPNAGRDFWVVVHPPVGCHTGSIFRALASLHGLESPRKSAAAIVDVLAQRGDEVQGMGEESECELAGLLYNRLELAASHTTEWVERTARRIDRYNPLGQCLTGSGSSRFCLCSTPEQAEKIASELRSFQDMRVYTASTWRAPPIDIQAERFRWEA